MEAQEVLAAYCEAMETIKLRTSLALVLANRKHNLPDFCVGELVQLQIRKICETLALGCLLVQGDVKGARSARLFGAYQADFIMNALEKLHLYFYPQPTKQILDANGKVVEWTNVKSGYLTKAELLKSYRDAGPYLHIGDLTDLLAKKRKSVDMGAVTEWVRKLGVLLTHHHIYLADPPGTQHQDQLRFDDGSPAPRRYLVVSMQTKPRGNVSATLFGAIGPVAKSAP